MRLYIFSSPLPGVQNVLAVADKVEEAAKQAKALVQMVHAREQNPEKFPTWVSGEYAYHYDIGPGFAFMFENFKTPAL
jgi:hypothetical protein